MIMKKIEKALKLLEEKLEGINYALVGSVNLYLQGVAVVPRDIDILTTPRGIKKIDKILKNYQTKEIYFDKSEGRNSYRTFFEINGIEVEVLGNVNNTARPKNSLNKRKIVNYEGIKLSCAPLREELKTYEKMGRIDKARLIKNKISP